MTSNISFQKTFGLLENAMDVARQRHSLMVGNVSNLDTPGYKAKDIDFKATMQKALDGKGQVNVLKTDPGHIGPAGNEMSQPDIFEEEGMWNGYNWMNVDKVVTKMILRQNGLPIGAARCSFIPCFIEPEWRR